MMIHLIIGPMFSGKSTELLRRLTRAQIAGKRVALLRPAIDTRLNITHDKRPLQDIKEHILENLDDFDAEQADVIGIDEGQFFSELAHFAHKWANQRKKVVIAGLDATSELTPFEEILNVVPLAEEVIKLNAVCMACGSENGAFTVFKHGEKRQKVQVGGQDMYEARCRYCIEHKLPSGKILQFPKKSKPKQ